jgi:hypothetical protein
MKIVAALLVTLTLSACSFIFPVPHDPVAFGTLVDLKISVDNLSCKNKDNWDTTFTQVTRLERYTELREDPQAKNIAQLKVALVKARESKNEVFCDSVLKVQRTRVDVITNAWRGR